jgi:predicted TIM-barrel enzyme
MGNKKPHSKAGLSYITYRVSVVVGVGVGVNVLNVTNISPN